MEIFLFCAVSAVSKRLLEFDYLIDFCNFDILATDQTEFNHLIQQSFLIKRGKLLLIINHSPQNYLTSFLTILKNVCYHDIVVIIILFSSDVIIFWKNLLVVRLAYVFS